MMFTKTEIKENITALKQAYADVVASGGVTSYTINSGQGSTTVQSASMSSIRNELKYWTDMLAELEEYENGEHCTFVRSHGV